MEYLTMKNKKGFPVLNVIAGIIIGVLIFVVISFVIKNTAHAAEAKTQTETCRLLNAIKAGVEEKSSGWAPGIRLCSTIDKTEGESQVPTKIYKEKYDDDKKAAAAEIRDMITKCWYMWLEGSETNMFTEYPNIETCFVCYMFKTRKEAGEVKFEDLENLMDEPYRPADDEGWCTPNGGIMKELCDKETEKETASTMAAAQGKKCCIKQDVRNQCENKGGVCREKAEGAYTEEYPEWPCPPDKICYVEKNKMETYGQYIASKGGDLYFISPQDARGYVSEQEYAISFVSPSGKCDAGCQAMWVGKSVSTDIGTYFQALGLQIIGLKSLAVRKYGEIAGDSLKEQPNFIIVSSLRDAQNLGCAIE